MTLTQLFTAIANEIRRIKGTSETIKAEDFATEMTDITMGIDTSDANAEPINIRKDKTAYVNGQKITGTLPVLTYPVNPDNPSDFDYQFIEASTAKKVTRSNTDYIMGAYQIAANNDPDSWMFEGNRKMKLGIAQSKVASAISLNANQIKKGEKVLGITGTYEGEGSSDYNAKIKPFDSSHRQINTAIQSFEPIDISQITVLTYGFQNLTSLITLPYMDFSHITNASQLCGGDESLINVPELDFSSLTGKNNYNMFSGCVSLSNESLNNILATCITMTNVTNKTLKYIGLSQEQATTCQTLSNWNDFVSAGWTTGY